jgi:hypothetical protein
MLSYTRLARSPSLFRTFSGLEVPEFDSLYEKVESRYDGFEERRLSRPGRKKGFGEAGRRFKLGLDDRLLTLLVYSRLYITLALTQFLFDLDLSNIWRDIRYLEPVVRECVPLPKKIHDQVRRLGTMEEVERYFPGFKAFVDSTEQEIPRPKDATKRRTHCSGKKRKHTVKTQLTVNGDGLIVHKAPHARGRRHDLAIYRGSHPSLPKEVEQDFDRGYDGIRDYFPGLKCALPFRKRAKGRGHRGEKAEELTPEQKSFNRELSKARVIVEHTISRVKKFNIFGQEFRNRLRHYEAMIDIVCGLVNARIGGSW